MRASGVRVQALTGVLSLGTEDMQKTLCVVRSEAAHLPLPLSRGHRQVRQNRTDQPLTNRFTTGLKPSSWGW